MIIPISPNATLDHYDKENKTTYRFKYLVGRDQERFEKLTSSGAKKVLDFIPRALREIKKKHPRMKEESLIKKAYQRAITLAEDAINKDVQSEIRYSRELISIFLAGYSSEVHELPKFDKSDPCKNLPYALIQRVAGIINLHLPQLIGLTEDDIKN